LDFEHRPHLTVNTAAAAAAAAAVYTVHTAGRLAFAATLHCYCSAWLILHL